MNCVVSLSPAGFGGAGTGTAGATGARAKIFARRTATRGRVARRLDFTALRFCLFAAIQRGNVTTLMPVGKKIKTKTRGSEVLIWLVVVSALRADFEPQARPHRKIRGHPKA